MRTSKRRRRFEHLDGDDLALLRALDAVDPALADRMEKSIRADHSARRSDALSYADLGEQPLDQLGRRAARFSHGAGGGRHRRPRMPAHA